MSIEIRKPNINAQDIEGQTAQIRSFLYELTNQLNWAMNTLTGEVAQVVVDKTKNDGSLTEMSAEEKLKTFNALKDLIIKSADIVEAYEQKMELDFESKFLAISNFGDELDGAIADSGITYTDGEGNQHTVDSYGAFAEYIQYLKSSIELSASDITQNYTDIQAIQTNISSLTGSVTSLSGDVEGLSSDLSDLDEEIEDRIGSKISEDLADSTTGLGQIQTFILQTNAYIKTGLLSNSPTTYGVEVGQTDTVDGVRTFSKFARFTSNRLSFYDSNGNEVGYYAGDKFYITKGEITNELILGKFLIDAKDGLRVYWYNT